MAQPVQVSAQTFKEEVLDSDLPVMVDFYADWCGPCRIVSPMIEELAEEHEGKVKVCKVDVSANMEIAASYGIMSIPTVMIFKGGEVQDRIIGAVPKQQLDQRLSEVLSS